GLVAGGTRSAEGEALINGGTSILAVDLLYQGLHGGDKLPANRSRAIENGREAACYVLGYNYPLFAQRVQDILSVIAGVRDEMPDYQQIDLVGLSGAGPWVAAAGFLAGDA